MPNIAIRFPENYTPNSTATVQFLKQPFFHRYYGRTLLFISFLEQSFYYLKAWLIHEMRSYIFTAKEREAIEEFLRFGDKNRPLKNAILRTVKKRVKDFQRLEEDVRLYLALKLVFSYGPQQQ